MNNGENADGPADDGPVVRILTAAVVLFLVALPAAPAAILVAITT